MRRIEREPNGSGVFLPGQDLVALGAIGKTGVLAAVICKREEILARYTEDFLERAVRQAEENLNLTPEILTACGASEWEYVEEGGILAALWNISGAYEQGIAFDLRKIPVKQEMIEICEQFDLNPYRLCSGECFVAAANNGGDLVREMETRGIDAAVIGKVETGIARRMTGLGSTGYLERPQRDEIYKITEARNL